MRRLAYILGPVIIVLDPLNIVFAEIASRLHLDEFEIDLSGVLQAVARADWHVDRFIFMHHLNLVANRRPRGATHDNPMLGSVVMQLQ